MPVVLSAGFLMFAILLCIVTFGSFSLDEWRNGVVWTCYACHSETDITEFNNSSDKWVQVSCSGVIRTPFKMK